MTPKPTSTFGVMFSKSHFKEDNPILSKSIPGQSDSTQSTNKIDVSDKVLSQMFYEEKERAQCSKTTESPREKCVSSEDDELNLSLLRFTCDILDSD